jgi:hypothetical protein
VDCVYVWADDDDAEMIEAIDMENDQVSTQNPRRLEYLKVNQPFIYDWLLGEQSQVDISNIHTLDICNGPENISKLFRRVGSSLEHLKIYGQPHYFDCQAFFRMTAQIANSWPWAKP